MSVRMALRNPALIGAGEARACRRSCALSSAVSSCASETPDMAHSMTWGLLAVTEAPRCRSISTISQHRPWVWLPAAAASASSRATSGSGCDAACKGKGFTGAWCLVLGAWWAFCWVSVSEPTENPLGFSWVSVSEPTENPLGFSWVSVSEPAGVFFGRPPFFPFRLEASMRALATAISSSARRLIHTSSTSSKNSSSTTSTAWRSSSERALARRYACAAGMPASVE